MTDRQSPSLDTVIERIRYFDAIPYPPQEAWYGLDQPIKAEIGLPEWYPLNCQSMHGPAINNVATPESANSDQPLLINRKELQDLFMRDLGVESFVIGTPQILYRRQHNISQRPDHQGTLAIPTHSSHHIKSVFDRQAYIDALKDLPDMFQPVTILLYWKDLLDGDIEIYQRNGFDVVSAGHMFDPEFTGRLYDILSCFSWVTSNSVGTHSILSLEMGIPNFHCGALPEFDDETGGDANSVVYEWTENDALEKHPIRRQLHDAIPDKVDTAPVISPELATLNSHIHGTDGDMQFDRLALYILRHMGDVIDIGPQLIDICRNADKETVQLVLQQNNITDQRILDLIAFIQRHCHLL